MTLPEKSLSSGKTGLARRDFLACMTGAELSQALRSRKTTSVELTRMHLKRLKRLDGQFKCVICTLHYVKQKEDR